MLILQTIMKDLDIKMKIYDISIVKDVCNFIFFYIQKQSYIELNYLTLSKKVTYF